MLYRIFRNPILPGFYPDPSICRVDNDYYLVTSTFEYFPGLPIFHSRDLVHWRQIGHVLDRPSQLNLDGIKASLGLYAPTIRHHDGVFYVINTHVSSNDDTLINGENHHRNFVVTATNPAGPWSEPIWLVDAPGIDCSLFFDEDGRVWYTGNRVPTAGEQFTGHREIWLQELNLGTMQLIGPKTSLWAGTGGVHAEAPHLYKINGMYYLLIAEGGTEHNHAVSIARSHEITGPYQNNPRNPILTHRHLGVNYPIACTGHAELVETQNGEWWMALLATRPYGGYYYNLGRETFLTPVIWEEGWPIVSPGNGRVEFEYPVPDLPEHRWPTSPVCDNFEADTLAPVWNFLRTPREDFWNLSDRFGYLRLFLRPQTLADPANPSFVGRRQQHQNFAARVALEFIPEKSNECAGLVLLQNNNFHFRFTVTQNNNGDVVAQLICRENGTETVFGATPVNGKRFYFKVEAMGQSYSFYIATAPEVWQLVAENVDGRILSTPVAAGFVGAYIGMYASSNGQPSDTVADFDWFEYTGLDLA